MPKKYSILVENDKVVAVEVDGVRYKTVGQIPDDDDRARMLFLTASWPDAEWGMPAAEPSPLPRLIVPLFLAVAVLMLAIAVFSGINTGRVLARETTAPGRVVDLVMRRDGAGIEFYYPVVEFFLPDETRQTVQLTAGSWPAGYEIGQAVTVAYDPRDPSTARIRSSSHTLNRYILTIITGVLGLAFAAATLFARWVLKPSPGEV